MYSFTATTPSFARIEASSRLAARPETVKVGSGVCVVGSNPAVPCSLPRMPWIRIAAALTSSLVTYAAEFVANVVASGSLAAGVVTSTVALLIQVSCCRYESPCGPTFV